MTRAVLLFLGVATLVGFLLRTIVGLRLRAVARRPGVTEADVCQLEQASRITSVAVLVSVIGVAVVGLAYVAVG